MSEMDPDEADAGYRESVRRYRERIQADRRREWREHFLGLAEVHERLAAENRTKALQLIDAAAREVR